MRAYLDPAVRAARRRWGRSALLAATLVLLTAAALATFGASSASATDTCATYTVSGTWNIDQPSHNGSPNYTGTDYQYVLSQSGTSVTGTALDNLDGLQASISGTLVGSTLDLVLTWPSYQSETVFTVSEAGLSGGAFILPDPTRTPIVPDTSTGPAQAVCVPATEPQSVTFLGAETGDASINNGPPNYTVQKVVQDSIVQWDDNGTWMPAYDVGGHPWGQVDNTDSWIACEPWFDSCSGTDANHVTTTYRVRFDVPADWANPTLTLTMRADNEASVTLNGQSIITNYIGGPTAASATATPALQAGVNELDFAVTDWGGIAGFNYSAVIDFDASSPATVLVGCAPGTYSDTGAEPCTSAPADSYVPDAWATSATPCAPGTTTNGLTGQTACLAIPPTVALQSISPAPNGNGWNDGAVTVTWACTNSQADTVSVVLSSDGADQSATGTCVGAIDDSLTASDTQTGINVDTAAPTDSPVVSPAANGAGWNNSDVTVDWNWSDGGSGVDPANCAQSSVSSGEGTITLTSTCADLAGNSASDSVTVQVDETAPALSPSVSPGVLAEGESVSASANATDAGSGIASASCGPVDTSVYGDFTVTCTATDLAGNSASASASYSVTVQATKRAVLAEVKAAEGSGSVAERVALKAAAAAIEASLSSRLWADGNHPSSRLVFTDEAVAVAALAADEHQRHNVIPDATLQGWIDALVADDRALAEIAITDATAAGDSSRELSKAAKDVSSGDSSASHGDDVAAVAHYADAWDDLSSVSNSYFRRHGDGDYRRCGGSHAGRVIHGREHGGRGR
jgi:hypothetical protein